MAIRYLGGDQRPDAWGVLSIGDVLPLSEPPEWGEWETTSDAPVSQPTPQPDYAAGDALDQPEPEPAPKPRPRVTETEQEG